jgi:uncharacterized protein YlzI (FlbEa/FlbD family)
MTKMLPFIKLTATNGRLFSVRLDRIDAFESTSRGCMVFTSGREVAVKEDSEAIENAIRNCVQQMQGGGQQ